MYVSLAGNTNKTKTYKHPKPARHLASTVIANANIDMTFHFKTSFAMDIRVKTREELIIELQELKQDATIILQNRLSKQNFWH
jgi:hypothetical protein